MSTTSNDDDKTYNGDYDDDHNSDNDDDHNSDNDDSCSPGEKLGDRADDPYSTVELFFSTPDYKVQVGKHIDTAILF